MIWTKITTKLSGFSEQDSVWARKQSWPEKLWGWCNLVCLPHAFLLNTYFSSDPDIVQQEIGLAQRAHQMRATVRGSREWIKAYLSITGLFQTSPHILHVTCFHTTVPKLLGWESAKVSDPSGAHLTYLQRPEWFGGGCIIEIICRKQT